MPHCSQSQLSFFPLFRRALTTQKRGGLTPWFNNGSSTSRRLGVHVYVISVTSLRRSHGHPKKRNAGKVRRAWAASDGRVKSIANFRGRGTLASGGQNSKISQKFRVKCKNKSLEGERGRRPRVICSGQRQREQRPGIALSLGFSPVCFQSILMGPVPQANPDFTAK